MTTIKLEQSNVCGKIKPMNAVNNGPAGSKVREVSNFELYEALEIPYARNHDAAFYSGYGGEHTVDVHRIFKNFDLDENDPENYVFAPTDQYIADTESVGTKTFYRLGTTIEHYYKFGTYPPKDFLKWAKICEHIIMHYTEGWANGFNYDIEYWEIWNEPDFLRPCGEDPCWQGSFDEFIDFYEIVAKHLKSRFPHLKIGGPAFTHSWKNETKTQFFSAVKQRNIPLDFYSFHGYIQSPEQLIELCNHATETLNEANIENTEIIYDEYNYIRNWRGEDFIYSVLARRGVKGSAYTAAIMSAGQASALDMIMYYDFRPCNWNGVFDELFRPQKPYYTFLMFRDLRRLGKWIKSDYSAGENVYYCAATDGKDSAIMITSYTDTDSSPVRDVAIDYIADDGNYKIEYYLTDETHNCELVKEETSMGDIKINLSAKLFDTYLIKITKE